MNNPAPTSFEVVEWIERRWSPRAFSTDDVPFGKVRSVLEASRWAASSRNAQPWRFVVGIRGGDDGTWEHLARALAPGNARWARRAPVLVLVVAASSETYALHDTGQATAHFLIEATAQGLATHPMAGFDAQSVRDALGIPAEAVPLCITALGWPGDASDLPQGVAPRERARTRRPQQAFVFGGRWGEALVFDEEREAQTVLDFWFGPLDEYGLASPERAGRWFRADPAFDEEIRSRFGALHAAVIDGGRPTWLGAPRTRLAAIVVADQFSRNLYRDTPRMFVGDPLALRWALDAIDRGWDRKLAAHERVFFYMPLMHSEDLAVQRRSVALFARLCDEAPQPARGRLEVHRQYAERHRATVDRFGRFPHRNAILGRVSTPEEEAFLRRARGG